MPCSSAVSTSSLKVPPPPPQVHRIPQERPLGETTRRRDSSLEEWRGALREFKAAEARRRMKNLKVISEYNEREIQRELIAGK